MINGCAVRFYWFNWWGCLQGERLGTTGLAAELASSKEFKKRTKKQQQKDK